MEDEKEKDIYPETLVLKKEKERFKILKKIYGEIKLLALPLKTILWIVDVVFEILFMVQLFEDGHKYWGIFQMFIFLFPIWFTLADAYDGLKKMCETIKDRNVNTSIWSYLCYSAFVFWIRPFIVFLGLYHSFEYVIIKKKYKDSKWLEDNWKFAIKLDPFLTVVKENITLVFKVYILIKGYSRGFYPIALIFMSWMYLLYVNFSTFHCDVWKSRLKFTLFELIFIPAIITLEKLSCVLFMTALLLEFKKFAFLILGIMFVISNSIAIWHLLTYKGPSFQDSKALSKFQNKYSEYQEKIDKEYKGLHGIRETLNDDEFLRKVREIQRLEAEIKSEYSDMKRYELEIAKDLNNDKTRQLYLARKYSSLLLEIYPFSYLTSINYYEKTKFCHIITKVL
jgi:Skp family chaperone for outer membrane proteins